MPQTFVIDQAATFSGVAFLEVAPRLVFGSQEQDKLADGTPKWDVQVVAGFKDMFNRSQHEVMKIGVASHTQPGEGLAPYTPVQLVNFVVGVVPPEIRKDNRGQDKVSGGTVWYRAEEIRPISAPTSNRKSAAVSE